MVNESSEVGVGDEVSQNCSDWVFVRENEKRHLFFVFLLIVIIFEVLSILVVIKLRFNQLIFLLLGTTGLRSGIVLLVKLSVEISIHMIGKGHELILNLLKLFLNI